jgi:hypothetical protein
MRWDMDFSYLDLLFDRDVRYSEAKRWNEELNAQLRRARTADRNLVATIEAILRENQEMRLRLGVLIRVMIEKGVMTTEDFAREMGEARAALAQPPAGRNPTVPKVGPPKGKLPKPPKKLPGAPQA